MNDCVIDATIVCLSNGDLANRVPGNSLDQKLKVLEEVTGFFRRLRYNSRLLNEYERLIDLHQNDVVRLFFDILDSPHAFRVSRNALSRQDHAVAIGDCGWPSHDQHLIAAAIGGVNPSIFVTEQKHATCAVLIWRRMRIQVEHIQ